MVYARSVLLFVVFASALLSSCTVSRRSALYEGCVENNDCTASADACFNIDWIDGRGGMCSVYCANDLECPGDSRCFELVGDPAGTRICYARCFDDLDCDFGFICTDADLGGTIVDSICLPN
jgi:hypothetical protein